MRNRRPGVTPCVGRGIRQHRIVTDTQPAPTLGAWRGRSASCIHAQRALCVKSRSHRQKVAVVKGAKSYYDAPCLLIPDARANMLPFELLSAGEVARELANRARAMRLHHGWTQVEAAARAGMTLASYKRFERTGEVAFKSLLKIALAFDQLGAFQRLFERPAFQSLDEAIATAPARVRAPRRRPS